MAIGVPLQVEVLMGKSRIQKGSPNATTFDYHRVSQNDRLEWRELSSSMISMRFEDVSVSKVMLQTQVPVPLRPPRPLLM